MSDDRVLEIRERLKRHQVGRQGMPVWWFESDMEFLLAELERARKVVEAARDAVRIHFDEGTQTGADMLLRDQLREYDAARSPDPAGGTAGVDAGKGESS